MAANLGADLAALKRDGFTSVEKLAEMDDVQQLRDYYDKILSGELKCGNYDRQLGGVTRQVMFLNRHIPYFQDNPTLRRALEIGEAFFGKKTVCTYDMLIYKPPAHPKCTPWHQDLAYHKMPHSEEGYIPGAQGLQFWVALDDVDASNGCMHFLKWDSTQGMKLHYVYSGGEFDEGHLLASKAFGDPDLPNGGIAVPLKAGGATIHLGGTPHYTTPNITKDRGRRAYIFNVGAVG